MFHVAWDNPEKTIVRVDLTENWTWDEFAQAVRQAYKWASEHGHTVDFICALSANFPPGHAIRALQSSGTQPRNVRHTVMVTSPTSGLRRLVETVDGMNRWAGPQFVDTLAEARAYLAKKATE